MIPATSIHFNDDGTAWTLLTELAQYCKASEFPELLDRPCDTCDGDGSVITIGTVMVHHCDHCMKLVPGNERIACPTCHGTGRHVFEIEVEAEVHWDCYRVHVVPGMVLPIVTDVDPAYIERQEYPLIVFDVIRNRFQHIIGPHIDDINDVTLPPDAKPGMWAVKLEVHQ